MMDGKRRRKGSNVKQIHKIGHTRWIDRCNGRWFNKIYTQSALMFE